MVFIGKPLLSNYTNCGQYDHICAFTVETPRRGVSMEFMIVSKAIGITNKSFKILVGQTFVSVPGRHECLPHQKVETTLLIIA